MEKSIFLLTAQKKTERLIMDCIPLNYNLISVSKNNLMIKLYEKRPVMFIVDLDYMNEQTLDIISSILSVMYIPIVYLHGENCKIDINEIKDEVLIDFDKVEFELKNLIKQAANFKLKYDVITESYDAIDLLSSSIKDFLNNTMYKEIMEKDNLILELFNLVLSKNKFISNKPDKFWIIEGFKDGYVGKLFTRSSDGDFCIKVSIEMNSSLKIDLDISSENGFYKNFYTDEISDIDSCIDIFPKAMLKASGKIQNFAGYSIDNITILGVNYRNIVSSYDISIIKLIAIYYDLINTINTNLKDIENSFEYTTNALARAAEVNDDSTGSHIKRVNTFSKMLALEMGMDKSFIKNIYNAAQMHDVGKIYVDKNILIKPGKLTEEEFENMKRHTNFGEIIIGDSENLKMASEIARNHHEKYDGSGYPDGKIGEEIPKSARIVALADIYDALRSKRTYKPGFTHQEAYNIITVGDGRVMPEHFDPQVLNAFKNIHHELSEVYDSLEIES
jgi:HD-GYP domain-containing protein (c-di-GMP phosphodiesterase class II)